MPSEVHVCRGVTVDFQAHVKHLHIALWYYYYHIAYAKKHTIKHYTACDVDRVIILNNDLQLSNSIIEFECRKTSFNRIRILSRNYLTLSVGYCYSLCAVFIILALRCVPENLAYTR